jgi:hypothetical protein
MTNRPILLAEDNSDNVSLTLNFTEFADAINTLGMCWLLLNETVPE